VESLKEARVEYIAALLRKGQRVPEPSFRLGVSTSAVIPVESPGDRFEIQFGPASQIPGDDVQDTESVDSFKLVEVPS
jgi:hypothetical protein